MASHTPNSYMFLIIVVFLPIYIAHGGSWDDPRPAREATGFDGHSSLYITIRSLHESPHTSPGILTAVVVSMVMALFVLVALVLVIWLTLRRTWKSTQGSRQCKSSIDPEQYLLYLNSLTQYLEGKSKTGESPRGKGTSMTQGNVSCETDAQSCLDEEIISSSNGTFHSTSRCQCSSSEYTEESPCAYSEIEERGSHCITISPQSDSQDSTITNASPKLSSSKNVVPSSIDGHIPKPPPPPPLPLSRSRIKKNTSLGNDGGPLPKLKPLYWDKVMEAPHRSMVWDNIKACSFRLDETMMESLFGYTFQTPTKNGEDKKRALPPTKNVLERKKLHNYTILFKALNVGTDLVCQTLLQGKGLSGQQLETLVKMRPSKDEEEKICNYGGGANELSSVEKFLKEVLKIPCAFERFQSMLYRDTFADESTYLRKSFELIEEACVELRSSKNFTILLEAVLITGNRMNIGTSRGGARAFKLDALLKLADVKGTDGRTTLLHFVVQEILRSSETTFSGLSIELTSVKKVANLDLDVLKNSVSCLSDGLNMLKCLLEEKLSKDGTDKMFVSIMRPFLCNAEVVVNEIKEAEKNGLLHVKHVTEYYHGDASREENQLGIFVIVRDFLVLLDRICGDIKSEGDQL